MKKILLGILLLSIFSCQNINDIATEKENENFDKKLNVNKSIIDIKTDILTKPSLLYLINDYLIVFDVYSVDRGIHIYNKNTFKYLTSTGKIGKGPGEINSYGYITIDKTDKAFWLADFAKLLLWKFPIDSVLKNDQFLPTTNIPLDQEFVLAGGEFINDSIILSMALCERSRQMAKFDIKNNVIQKYGYVHPEVNSKRIKCHLAISKKHNMYAKGNKNYDLMTICDLDGTLKYNIYGPKWSKKIDKENSFFGRLLFYENHIFVSYLGTKKGYINEYGRSKINSPSSILIFDINGNYIKRIDTDNQFRSFCIDKENERVIVYFEDRDNPLGYFDLNLNKL